MKTYVVIPAAYGGAYEFQAEKFGGISKESATLLDKEGNIVAIVSLDNIAVVYQNEVKD